MAIPSKLKIIAVDHDPVLPSRSLSKTSGRHERTLTAQLQMDRFWMKHSMLWDPQQSSREIERLHRTIRLILKHTDLKGLTILDLGCGEGSLTRLLHDCGAHLHAVDASANALKLFKERCDRHSISIPSQVAALPITQLDSASYDLVICTDVIAELDHRDFRLAMSELARLVKKSGWVVCSTQVDCYSEDALDRFLELFQTEFDLYDVTYSHHRILPKVKSRAVMLWLEKFSRAIWQREGITHVIALGKLKSLI